jgi:hypothetical protein
MAAGEWITARGWIRVAGETSGTTEAWYERYVLNGQGDELPDFD